MNDSGATSIQVESNPPSVQMCRPGGGLNYANIAIPCIMIAVYLAFLIFFIVMTVKFVKAHEKIAGSLEKLVNQKTDIT